jgi:hypothetical protein
MLAYTVSVYRQKDGGASAANFDSPKGDYVKRGDPEHGRLGRSPSVESASPALGAFLPPRQHCFSRNLGALLERQFSHSSSGALFYSTRRRLASFSGISEKEEFTC